MHIFGMEREARWAAGLALGLLLQGCSALRTATLRDAQVLPRHDYAIGLEGSSVVPQVDATAERAVSGDPRLDSIWALRTSKGIESDDGAPMIGLSYSIGLGDGFQFDAAFNTGALVMLGANEFETGLAYNLWDDGTWAFTAYGRGRFGYTDAEKEIGKDETLYMRMAAGDWDAFAMATRSVTQKLRCYADLGGGTGWLGYRWKYADDKGYRPWNQVGIFALKGYGGIVVSGSYVELYLEGGWVATERGGYPSLGIRLALDHFPRLR